MPIGVSLQLFEGAVAQASLTGIQALWWDVEQPYDAKVPIGRSNAVTTDASGYISLDLSNVSGLTVGDYGFLTLYKLDGVDHQDSLVFSGKVQTSTVASGVDMQPPAATSTWVRNPSWTPMPDLTGLQKFAGLHAVHPDSNFCALTATGNFTVDWGDGVVENISSGVTVYHQFVFSDVDLANTDAPVTLQDTGDTITRTAHGYTNGMTVVLYNLVSTTGVVAGQTYFVVGATANTFQVSATSGGSALPLTTDGTATLLPYKLAMVTVVPNGGNLTSLNLHLKHNQSLLPTYSSGFLDIAIRATLMTDLRIGTLAPGPTYSVAFSDLAQVNIIASNLKQCQGLFRSCFSLANVIAVSTSSDAASSVACTFQDVGNTVTATAHGMVNGQTVSFASIALTTGITIDTWYFVVGVTTDTFQVASTYGGGALALATDGTGTVVIGTDFSYMFYDCCNLQTIPLLNTVAGLNFRYMFFNCYALRAIPKLDTAAGADFSYMFGGCSCLPVIPLLNTAAGKDFAYMFGLCGDLQAVPLLNTAAGKNFYAMFQTCYRLQAIPKFNTAAGKNFNNMFVYCYALTSVPLLNTAAGTNFDGMFRSCSSLEEIPLLNTVAGTNLNGMFAFCVRLLAIPALNTTACTDFGSLVSGCYALREMPLLDTAAGTNFYYTFADCNSLRTIPLINTAAGTSFYAMFANCKTLQTIPPLNTGAGLNFGYMFYNCLALQAIPALNTAAATDLSGMYGQCPQLSQSKVVNTKITHSYADCKLSATALNEIYTNLFSPVTTKTITVSNNWGTASDTPSIATAKGWTVTG